MTLAPEVDFARPANIEGESVGSFRSYSVVSDKASLSADAVMFRSRDGGLDPAGMRGDWLDDSIADVRRWLGEQPNWDGYGARRISPRVAGYALALLRQLAPFVAARPFVTGTSEGGLNLQWENDALDFQIIIEDGQVCAYYHNKRTDAEWEGPVSSSSALLTEALGALALG